MEELFGRIRQFGGVPCIAHAWNWTYETFNGGESYCVEVYSAYAEALKDLRTPYFTATDRNKTLLANWDKALIGNQRIYAIAVNDHFGPQTRAPISPQTIDSGKILVLARSATDVAAVVGEVAFREALRGPRRMRDAS